MSDLSQGYDSIADQFMTARSDAGRNVIAGFAATLPKDAEVMDIGAGHGAPVTATLIEAGTQVWAIDPSPRMVAAFAARFPSVPIACETVAASTFFDRRYDAAVAVGVIFLLPEADQMQMLARMASAVRADGALLFSAPHQTATWTDVLTKRASRSLGRARYRDLLTMHGFDRIKEHDDPQGTHYFAAWRGVAHPVA